MKNSAKKFLVKVIKILMTYKKIYHSYMSNRSIKQNVIEYICHFNIPFWSVKLTLEKVSNYSLNSVILYLIIYWAVILRYRLISSVVQYQVHISSNSHVFAHTKSYPKALKSPHKNEKIPFRHFTGCEIEIVLARALKCKCFEN